MQPTHSYTKYSTKACFNKEQHTHLHMYICMCILVLNIPINKHHSSDPKCLAATWHFVAAERQLLNEYHLLIITKVTANLAVRLNIVYMENTSSSYVISTVHMYVCIHLLSEYLINVQ